VKLLQRRVRYDLEYINNWTLLLDVEIIFADDRAGDVSAADGVLSGGGKIVFNGTGRRRARCR